MKTAEQYSVLSDKVYKVDIKNKENVYRVGKDIYDNPKYTDQKFKVLKTIDTNDPKNSHGYDTNGFQGMAVAPVNKVGEVDYLHNTSVRLGI
ncbi:hypothetical protein [Latilactobacillus graminis]|uniref:Uncharacterized protein n=1 Tax=Latilactobacillus graminis TaxID=60519 RepID=A0ABX6CBN1_9LACO|nr:hypothetical protein [Latilactobacillus graminis]QFP80206.1 hypothetical protein LG542_08265 [Latilactobacillus graminis]